MGELQAKVKCSNCLWRLLKVRCNNGNSAVAATTTITTSSSSWTTLQRQQQASLLCGFVMPTKVSFSQALWLALRRHLYCSCFLSLSLVRSFARRGFFGNLALLHKFQWANGSRTRPGQRGILHVWLPLLLLAACCFRCRWLRLNDLLFVCFVSIWNPLWLCGCSSSRDAARLPSPAIVGIYSYLAAIAAAARDSSFGYSFSLSSSTVGGFFNCVYNKFRFVSVKREQATTCVASQVPLSMRRKWHPWHSYS